MSSGLVRALTNPESEPPLLWRTGIVRSVTVGTDPVTNPSVCSVDISGVTVAGVTFAAPYDLEVGTVVQLLQQGPRLFVFAAVHPARIVVGAHNHTTPPVNPTSPPAPPAAPSAPASVRTVGVTATASSSWVPAFSNWRADGVYQGGTGQRGFWFYGGGIAAAKGAGTIVSGSIFVKRSSSGGVSGAANVRLGTHGYTSQPGSGSAAHGNVAQVGSLGPGAGATFPLTDAHIAALNAGAAGLGLEPGAGGYVTADYFISQPRSAGDWSGALQLTISG